MDEAYKRAKKKVKKKKEFYKEVGAYVPIAIGLMLLNLYTGSSYLWFLWAVVPWGITILIKGIKIGVDSKTDDWEEKEMRKELRALGKDPEDYMDSPLELKELESEYAPNEGYRDSDLV